MSGTPKNEQRMDSGIAAAKLNAVGAVATALIAVCGVLITVQGSFETWSQTEKSKRIDEEINWKKERYAELIKNSKGFYIPSDQKIIDEFLRQYNLCLMYCPDEVIRKINSFLETVHTQNKGRYSDNDRETALAELVLEMRKDLLKREFLNQSNLQPKDFKHIKATESQSFVNDPTSQNVTNSNVSR